MAGAQILVAHLILAQGVRQRRRLRDLGLAIGLAQSAQVHERLERAADLTGHAGGAIERRLNVVTPADDGTERTRSRIDRRDGTLERRVAGLAAPPGEAFEPTFQALRGAQLQHRVDAGHERRRAVDSIPPPDRLPLAFQDVHVVPELGLVEVDAVGRQRRGSERRRDRRRTAEGAWRGSVLGLRHPHVACRPGDGTRIVGHAFGIAPRRRGVRGADRGREPEHLVVRELGERFPEEEACTFGDAVDVERALVSEVDVVEVDGQDLLLREPALDDQRQNRFVDLGRELAAGAIEDQLDGLLGDGAAALHDPPMRQVADQSADDATHVHTAVLEKPAVFGGERRSD